MDLMTTAVANWLLQVVVAVRMQLMHCAIVHVGIFAVYPQHTLTASSTWNSHKRLSYRDGERNLSIKADFQRIISSICMEIPRHKLILNFRSTKIFVGTGNASIMLVLYFFKQDL